MVSIIHCKPDKKVLSRVKYQEGMRSTFCYDGADRDANLSGGAYLRISLESVSRLASSNDTLSRDTCNR